MEGSTLFFGSGVLVASLLYAFRKRLGLTGTTFRFAYRLAYAKFWITYLLKRGKTAADVFEACAKKNPRKVAIIEADTRAEYTFSELEAMSGKVATWASSLGLSRGDTVALFMPNRAEYVAIWLGMSRIGVATALININLRATSLRHSLDACSATVIIVGSELVDEFTSSGVKPPRGGIWRSSQGAGWIKKSSSIASSASASASACTYHDLDATLRDCDKGSWSSADRASSRCRDVVMYIFTSGTTGLPKPAKVTNERFIAAGIGFSSGFCVHSDDVIYCCLPLYHSAAGILGVSMSWAKGATLVIRPKFSASKFWTDCAENDCTVVQYIGQLCRYLVAQPSNPSIDRSHRVRLAVGNGLRPDVWPVFQERFGISEIGEFYGATEGNATLLNTDGKVGAVGFLSPLITLLYPVFLVRFDIETGTLYRDPKTGKCVRCRPGEVGELLGFIDNNDPSRRFDGYEGNPELTKKKIASSVFRDGDQWFRSGDLLRQDDEGFFYFVDRIGDTFRWKGENVSTNEVAEVINTVKSVHEANVYGVEVANSDGRAGMASLVPAEGCDAVDIDDLYKVVTEQLPAYARPLFVRISPEMEITGTFKHRKVDLVKDGYDPRVIRNEEIYFRDDSPQVKRFVKLNDDLFAKIQSGHIRL